MRSTTKILIGLVVFTIIIVNVFGRKEKITNPNDLYRKNWQTAVDNEYYVEIARLIVKNNYGGCGSMYLKESTETKNEFLLACTSDLENYDYYLVWPNTGSIMKVKDEGFKKPNQ